MKTTWSYSYIEKSSHYNVAEINRWVIDKIKCFEKKTDVRWTDSIHQNSIIFLPRFVPQIAFENFDLAKKVWKHIPTEKGENAFIDFLELSERSGLKLADVMDAVLSLSLKKAASVHATKQPQDLHTYAGYVFVKRRSAYAPFKTLDHLVG